MSENKRENVKITIETPDGNTSTFEADGIAFVAIEDEGEDNYGCRNGIMGNMSIADLMMLEHSVEADLLLEIRKNIRKHAREHSDEEPPVLTFLKSLLGVD